MKKKNIIRLMIFLLILIIISLIVFIVFLTKNSSNEGTNINSNEAENYINNNNINNDENQTIIDNNLADTEQTDLWNNTEQSSKQIQNSLEDIYDTYTYFLMKQCITTFYNVQTVQNALNLIDEEAKSLLNINANNVSSLFSGFNNPQICIEKIFKQNIDSSKSLYVVYYKLQKNIQSNSQAEDRSMFVKIDEKNVDFSVYPYEYLANLNYLELEAEDIVTLNNTKEVQVNEDNKYYSDLISKDDKVCIKELFDRYKFNIQFNVDGLYSEINANYKELKFPDIQNFYEYVNETKEKILNSEISKYKVNKYDEYNQYVAVFEDDSRIIFDAVTIMNYKIMLDSYSVVTEEYYTMYQANLPHVQAQYCINRVIKAINNKNYEFVYSKLNPVQKNNYFSRLEDLRDFIQNNFYEENYGEIDSNYIELDQNTYQYNMQIKNKADENSSLYKDCIMTINLKDAGDFTVSIVMPK